MPYAADHNEEDAVLTFKARVYVSLNSVEEAGVIAEELTYPMLHKVDEAVDKLALTIP